MVMEKVDAAYQFGQTTEDGAKKNRATELLVAELRIEIERLRGLIEGLRNVRLNPTDADMPAAKALYAELSNYQQDQKVSK